MSDISRNLLEQTMPTSPQPMSVDTPQQSAGYTPQGESTAPLLNPYSTGAIEYSERTRTFAQFLLSLAFGLTTAFSRSGGRSSGADRGKLYSRALLLGMGQANPRRPLHPHTTHRRSAAYPSHSISIKRLRQASTVLGLCGGSFFAAEGDLP